MKTWRGVAAIAAVGLCGAVGACSAKGVGATDDKGAAGDPSLSSGSGATTGAGTGGSDFGGDTGSGAAQGAGGEAACAGEKSTAELVPLDMYIMLDASGSMNDETATGDSKWDAVKSALEAFFTNPDAGELGAGLQYFPLGDSSQTGPSCTSDADCSGTTVCSLPKACSDNRPFGFCNADADCGAGVRCVTTGNCTGNFLPCTNIGGSCGGTAGDCRLLLPGNCLSAGVCDVRNYTAPEVEIAPLSASGPALVSSINDMDPEGGTPTAGALTGALQHAQDFAAAHANHKVVTVLVTDGLPSECSPQDATGLATIAEDALHGTPSVSTFTIGVFAPGDTDGRDTVNAIAQGGGTTQAFIVDPTQDVSRAFLDALNDIRGQTLACEYQIPAPAGGQVVDFGKVNVEHTPAEASSATTIFYVANEGSCDPATGGWHYDVDPATGATPTKIVMCGASCNALKAGGEVAISVGCKTEVATPR